MVDFLEQGRRASAQSEEGDLRLIEPIEPIISGELGVEDQVLWRAAMLAGPEVDEAENFIGFLALTDVGV